MDKNLYKKEIINKAIKLHLQGNIPEASKYYQRFINQGYEDHRIFSNYGAILQSQGKLEEAEKSYHKAIKVNPDFLEAYSNLGNILRDLGKLKQAKFYLQKAIKVNPDFSIAHSNLGNVFKDLGKLKDAEFSTRKAIELNPNIADFHLNLGGILKDLGKLKDAEISTRKAIELNPNFADAHLNLGSILKDRGKLKNAELLYLKSIELNPNLAIAYYSLSLFKFFDSNKKWRDKLFSRNILNNNSRKDQVNIYFARANILHNESNFKDSSRYLLLANNLKQTLNPSNLKDLLKLSKKLMLEANKEFINTNENSKKQDTIFIVGMLRSGSTLLESILSMNNNVDDLGEKNILADSFLNWKTNRQKLTLEELYFRKINSYVNQIRLTTNKWLYNYQYTGIIARHIPKSKIIHCFRNPLDNILSIYRANFETGNAYSSSLVDCAKVYLDQEEVMNQYKKRFRGKIYDLNYDSLVSNPEEEIKSLISWLGWKWNDQYLSPHQNPRSVSTASNIKVRYPINSRSVGGWKNYKELLRPAMEIITQNDKYTNLKY